jgi:hypothetical protein
VLLGTGEERGLAQEAGLPYPRFADDDGDGHAGALQRAAPKVLEDAQFFTSPDELRHTLLIARSVRGRLPIGGYTE